MTPAWWEGLAPVETAGPAGAEEHRLTFEDGELHLVAHPDPEADRTLAAFGGEVCPCLDLFEAWTQNHETGRVLVVGARGLDETLAAPAAAVDAIAADLARWRGALAALRADARAEGDGDVLDRLASLRSPEHEAALRRLGDLLLLTLDRRLQHRLQASVAASMAARLGSGSVPAALTAATAARAIGALRGLGWSGGFAEIEVGDAPSLTAAHAVLPSTWIADVWGRGVLLTPDGSFVLDVTSVTDERGLTVLAAAPGKPQVEIRVDQWENA